MCLNWETYHMYRLSLAVLTIITVAVGGSSRAQAADLYSYKHRGVVSTRALH